MAALAETQWQNNLRSEKAKAISILTKPRRSTEAPGVKEECGLQHMSSTCRNSRQALRGYIEQYDKLKVSQKTNGTSSNYRSPLAIKHEKQEWAELNDNTKDLEISPQRRPSELKLDNLAVENKKTFCESPLSKVITARKKIIMSHYALPKEIDRRSSPLTSHTVNSFHAVTCTSPSSTSFSGISSFSSLDSDESLKRFQTKRHLYDSKFKTTRCHQNVNTQLIDSGINRSNIMKKKLLNNSTSNDKCWPYDENSTCELPSSSMLISLQPDSPKQSKTIKPWEQVVSATQTIQRIWRLWQKSINNKRVMQEKKSVGIGVPSITQIERKLDNQLLSQTKALTLIENRELGVNSNYFHNVDNLEFVDFLEATSGTQECVDYSAIRNDDIYQFDEKKSEVKPGLSRVVDKCCQTAWDLVSDDTNTFQIGDQNIYQVVDFHHSSNDDIFSKSETFWTPGSHLINSRETKVLDNTTEKGSQLTEPFVPKCTLNTTTKTSIPDYIKGTTTRKKNLLANTFVHQIDNQTYLVCDVIGERTSEIVHLANSSMERKSDIYDDHSSTIDLLEPRQQKEGKQDVSSTIVNDTNSLYKEDCEITKLEEGLLEKCVIQTIADLPRPYSQPISIIGTGLKQKDNLSSIVDIHPIDDVEQKENNSNDGINQKSAAISLSSPQHSNKVSKDPKCQLIPEFSLQNPIPKEGSSLCKRWSTGLAVSGISEIKISGGGSNEASSYFSKDLLNDIGGNERAKENITKSMTNRSDTSDQQQSEPVVDCFKYSGKSPSIIIWDSMTEVIPVDNDVINRSSPSTAVTCNVEKNQAITKEIVNGAPAKESLSMSKRVIERNEKSNEVSKDEDFYIDHDFDVTRGDNTFINPLNMHHSNFLVYSISNCESSKISKNNFPSFPIEFAEQRTCSDDPKSTLNSGEDSGNGTDIKHMQVRRASAPQLKKKTSKSMVIPPQKKDSTKEEIVPSRFNSFHSTRDSNLHNNLHGNLHNKVEIKDLGSCSLTSEQKGNPFLSSRDSRILRKSHGAFQEKYLDSSKCLQIRGRYDQSTAYPSLISNQDKVIALRKRIRDCIGQSDPETWYDKKVTPFLPWEIANSECQLESNLLHTGLKSTLWSSQPITKTNESGCSLLENGLT